MQICTMKQRFCPRLTFRASWKIILFALLKAYERIIKYVAPTSWKFMPIINQYFFSRISSSALLCGLVSLVRTRNRVTLDLPMSPRWSDQSRAKKSDEKETRQSNSKEIKYYFSIFQIFLSDKFRKTFAQHLYFSTSVITDQLEIYYL